MCVIGSGLQVQLSDKVILEYYQNKTNRNTRTFICSRPIGSIFKYFQKILIEIEGIFS